MQLGINYQGVIIEKNIDPIMIWNEKDDNNAQEY